MNIISSLFTLCYFLSFFIYLKMVLYARDCSWQRFHCNTVPMAQISTKTKNSLVPMRAQGPLRETITHMTFESVCKIVSRMSSKVSQQCARSGESLPMSLSNSTVYSCSLWQHMTYWPWSIHLVCNYLLHTIQRQSPVGERRRRRESE